MISIGEFSMAARLSIKTLRFYHSQGILNPAWVDPDTGYRYYDRQCLAQAKSIAALKELGFTIAEIKLVLAQCSDESELETFVEQKIAELQKKLAALRKTEARLLQLKASMKQSPNQGNYQIVEETLSLPHLLCLSVLGEFSDVGQAFGKLYRQARGKSRGKPLALYPFVELPEPPVSFFGALELSEPVEIGHNFALKSLGPIQALSLVHQGPYGSQGPSYMSIFEEASRRGFHAKAPLVERYLKGPGMIFAGNPDQYVTQLIVPLGPKT